jgi:hypothetical protein
MQGLAAGPRRVRPPAAVAGPARAQVHEHTIGAEGGGGDPHRAEPVRRREVDAHFGQGVARPEHPLGHAAVRQRPVGIVTAEQRAALLADQAVRGQVAMAGGIGRDDGAARFCDEQAERRTVEDGPREGAVRRVGRADGSADQVRLGHGLPGVELNGGGARDILSRL